jgi:hypothetical protein
MTISINCYTVDGVCEGSQSRQAVKYGRESRGIGTRNCESQQQHSSVTLYCTNVAGCLSRISSIYANKTDKVVPVLN